MSGHALVVLGRGPFSSSKQPLRMWDLDPNGITIGSAAFAGFTVVTDRPTDRPR